MLIGQSRLKSEIAMFGYRFPRFSIIYGNIGKRTVAKYIADQLKLKFVECGIGIDDVRDVLDTVYRVSDPILYVFPNADKMSAGAKNALLKITEEPPLNAYFVLTVNRLENILPTLISRATVLKLDGYSVDELKEYVAYENIMIADELASKFYELCENPRDALALSDKGSADICTFARDMVNNVVMAKDGTMFKYTKRLKLKETSDGYDPILVFKYIKKLCYNKVMQGSDRKYLLAYQTTDSCLRDLETTYNKVATVDSWIFNIREILR